MKLYWFPPNNQPKQVFQVEGHYNSNEVLASVSSWKGVKLVYIDCSVKPIDGFDPCI